jgi:hypothetical protein
MDASHLIAAGCEGSSVANHPSPRPSRQRAGGPNDVNFGVGPHAERHRVPK